MAQNQGLDLVEMSPNADPPVCKIMDYGKFRYDEGMKRKQARKQQQKQDVKEITFSASVDPHDLEIKERKMREFLSDGNKVKVTLKYRGRENAHKDLGFEVMQQVIKDMEDAATCEQPPKLLGKFLGCLLAPRSTKGKSPKAPKPPKPASPDAQAPAPAQPAADSPSQA
jgi:translation initiation factor IF-3